MAGPQSSQSEGQVVEDLTEQESLDLLAQGSVGRVAFVDRGQPMAVPVNYILDGRTVAFRTDPGTSLDAATLGRLAFEIDGLDPVNRSGWTVLVTGIGRDITGGIDEWSEHVRSHHLEPWAAGERQHWIALAEPTFSGRRLRRGEH
jgi:nitroimidazol reductase NimA-like FMN-containing flavoprotein (pyridoxamine 5'-phosphate oxidase superfamily)